MKFWRRWQEYILTRLRIEDVADLSKIGSINKYFKPANDIDASKEAMEIVGIFTDGKDIPIRQKNHKQAGHKSFAGFMAWILI